MKPKGAQSDAVKSEWGVECSTCLGSNFQPDGDDFICLCCGAIIAGPWPTTTAVDHQPLVRLPITNQH